MRGQAMRKIAGMLAAIVAAAGVALAAQPIEVRIEAFKEVVIEKDGKTERRWAPPKSVVPGDVIVYRVRFANKGDKPAEDVVVTDPLPKGVVYIPGSATHPEAELLVSADGKRFAPEGKLFVRDEKTGKKRPARPEEIRALRWKLKKPLAPGAEGRFVFKAKVR
ncbi:MAG: DUF11 domain-containing protein [Zetaproteobacteria bacterium]|nr:MAG: DUF11 domain-containing protein [Zetaproteobacteria bacterium]